MKIQKLKRIFSDLFVDFINLALSNIEFSNVVIDSRKAEKGSLFVPLKGEKTDGHKFIESAIKNGAVAYLTQYKIFDGKKINYPNGILVKDTYKALTTLASYKFKRYLKQSIAITGSSGKSTTKFLFGHILKHLGYNVFIPEGNLNGIYGTPLALANIDSVYDIGVLEFAMADFGEIKTQVGIAPADARVLLNVAPAHTEYVKNLKGVIKAKGEIFINSKKAVLPRNLVKYYNDILPKDTLTFGGCTRSNLRVVKHKLVEEGTEITFQVVRLPYTRFEDVENAVVRGWGGRPLRGRPPQLNPESNTFTIFLPFYNLKIGHNIAASFLALELLQIPWYKAITSLSTFTPFKGRGNIEAHTIMGKKVTIINESYNANGLSMTNAIKTFDKIPTTNTIKIMVLGKMAELGKYEEPEHKKVVKTALTTKTVNYIIFYGAPHYKNTLSSYITDSTNIYYADTVDKARKIVENIIEQIPKSQNIMLMAKASNSQQAWKIWDTSEKSH